MDEIKSTRDEYMTEEEMQMVDDYLNQIEESRSLMDPHYTQWEKIDEVYSCDQELETDQPNTRANIVNANIEGQVAMIMAAPIDCIAEGQTPSDKPFEDVTQAACEWVLQQNNIKLLIEHHERRRCKFGPGTFKITFDPTWKNNFGLPVFSVVPPNRFFVDSSITSPLDFCRAEHMGEEFFYPDSWFKKQKRFNEEAVKNLRSGDDDRSPIWNTQYTTQDKQKMIRYLQIWRFENGNLQLLEFTGNGVLLYKSDSSKPYYKYNKYPYFFTPNYVKEGDLWGFGDGKLLVPLQETINKLYDQIMKAAKPNKFLIDPASEIDPESFNDDETNVAPCNNPNQNVRQVEMGRVNANLWQLIASFHTEAQRATRYSELMMGQSSKASTATEAVIQQQQGNSATDHKKMMLELTLGNMLKYAFSMMLEHYDAGKMFRIAGDPVRFVWADFNSMKNIPVMVPADSKFKSKWKKSNEDAPPPEFMVLESKGKGQTRDVDIDIKVTVGDGLPKNKQFILQLMQSLAPWVIEGKPVLTWEEARKYLSEDIGLPLQHNDYAGQQIDQSQEQTLQREMQLQQAGAPEATAGMAEGGPSLSDLPGRALSRAGR
jgi:hypothetical protein